MTDKFTKKIQLKSDYAPMSSAGCDIMNNDKRYLVAIASSTGGPKALQSVISKLPKDLNAPVLIVQHMPEGFTASLADRLNNISKVEVSEAIKGEEIVDGHVYLARGGAHLKVKMADSKRAIINYTDEPLREGVKPCANYLFESLVDTPYDTIICVVLTGMGADGTVGIRNLKQKKNVYVISQDQQSSVVYGMPRSVAAAGLSNQVVSLENIAQAIISKITK